MNRGSCKVSPVYLKVVSADTSLFWKIENICLFAYAHGRQKFVECLG